MLVFDITNQMNCFGCNQNIETRWIRENCLLEASDSPHLIIFVIVVSAYSSVTMQLVQK